MTLVLPQPQSAQAVVEILGEALAERKIELRVAKHVVSFSQRDGRLK